ncbi:ABC transporter permease [Senegalia massiliensis]|uniref:ABC transporter permease n=1 Tax=Senegalia massiliensis TaxID=1720316 RepID=A0A845R079_9CLOT|nr:ABC transporter permease [Senegalia massiliensis]NBI07981.1 ABC transporter permease [Senegalia massiliensis]
MIKKIWNIFKRDLKVNKRNFLSLYLILFPIIIAIGINIFAPGIEDTTVNLALLKEQNESQIRFFKDFANVETFKTKEDIEKRVRERDNIIGIIPDGNDYYIMPEGDEPQELIDLAKTLNSLYELDVNIEDTNVELIDLGKEVPPLKQTLVNGVLLLIAVLGGMLISFNIVEEKTDNTTSAINVTPTTRNQFILGKSIIGISFVIFGSLSVVLITGFTDINYLQLLTMILVGSIISLLLGFIQGINNSDVMSAAASIKVLFLPLIGSVLAIELLSDKWQNFFYWIPFYWSYKGNKLVLSGTGNWSQILIYSAIVLIISFVVYLALHKKIRKGLE